MNLIFCIKWERISGNNIFDGLCGHSEHEDQRIVSIWAIFQMKSRFQIAADTSFWVLSDGADDQLKLCASGGVQFKLRNGSFAFRAHEAEEYPDLALYI